MLSKFDKMINSFVGQEYLELSESSLPTTFTVDSKQNYKILSIRPITIEGAHIRISGTGCIHFKPTFSERVTIKFAPSTASPSGERFITILSYPAVYDQTKNFYLSHSFILAPQTWSASATTCTIAAGWAPIGYSPEGVSNIFVKSIRALRLSTNNIDTGSKTGDIRRCLLQDAAGSTIHAMINESSLSSEFSWKSNNPGLLWSMTGRIQFTGIADASDTYLFLNIIMGML